MSFVTHAIFVGSFVTTFAFLYYVSSYISAVLTAHGYRPGDLILIGLERKNITGDEVPAMLTPIQIWEAIKADKATQAALAAGVVTVVVLMSRLFKSKPRKYNINIYIFLMMNSAFREEACSQPTGLAGIPSHCKVCCISKHGVVCIAAINSSNPQSNDLFAGIVSHYLKPMTFLVYRLDNTFLSKP